MAILVLFLENVNYSFSFFVVFFIFCCSCRIFFASPLLSWWYFLTMLVYGIGTKRHIPFSAIALQATVSLSFMPFCSSFPVTQRSSPPFPTFFFFKWRRKKRSFSGKKEAVKGCSPFFAAASQKPKSHRLSLLLLGGGGGRGCILTPPPFPVPFLAASAALPRSGSLGRVPPPPPLPPFFRLNTEQRERESPSRFCPSPLPLLFQRRDKAKHGKRALSLLFFPCWTYCNFPPLFKVFLCVCSAVWYQGLQISRRTFPKTCSNFFEPIFFCRLTL